MCVRHCETGTEIRATVRWYDGYEDLTGIKCLGKLVTSDERVGCEYAMLDSYDSVRHTLQSALATRQWSRFH